MAAEEIHDASVCKRVDDGITRVFQLLGKRWSGPILSVLMSQPTHFADLRRAIPGISERMLSDRLAELGAAGLVVREVDEGPPLRVSYRVTGSGAALEPSIRGLGEWAKEYLPDAPPCDGTASAGAVTGGAGAVPSEAAGAAGSGRAAGVSATAGTVPADQA